MKERVLSSILITSCVLLSGASKSAACGSGTTSITNLFSPTGDTFQAASLSSNGLITGFYYGSVPPHAFLYQSGSITDLGTLGGMISEGFAVNSSGLVVGGSYTGGNQFDGFLYSGASLVDLGTLGGPFSSASFINDAGQIAGDSQLVNATDTTAFIYTDGRMHNLGTLGGTYSSAFSLNNFGQVAGESSITNGDIHGFVSTPAGLLDLGTLGGDYSSAFAINDAGVVVGESALSNTYIHGFVFSGGVMADVGTFGGTYSSSFQINSNGQVIGIAGTAGDAEMHGFIYSNGSLLDLGTLGGTSVSPAAINNRGQIVGTASAADGTSHAFLWQTNHLTDLNTLLPASSGWQLANAQFINDAGRIVGSGSLNGVAQTFILDLPNGNNPPVAVAGPDQVIDCQAQATLDGSGSTDPDGDALTFEWSSGGNVLGTSSVLSIALPLGTNVVTLKVTDACGASSQTNLTVVVADTTQPVGSCPAPVTVSSDSNCQAPVPDLASQVIATDNCTPPQSLTITQTPLAGTLVGLGSHPVTITVTDASGNSSTCTVPFTVVDTTPPVILHTPGPINLSAGVDCQAQVPDVLANVTATDSCTSVDQLVKVQSPAAGTLIGIGASSIRVTVSDAAGNKASTTVSLTVADTTAPSILSGPAPIKLSADARCQAVVPNILNQVLVSDNCTPAGQIALTQNPSAGAVLPSGLYTIAVTATDASGNSSKINVPLEIDDTTPPIIVSAPAPVTLSADAHCQATVPNVLSGVLATDNCTPANQLVITQSPAAGTVLTDGQYSIVVTVSDAAGNSATTSIPLIISDTTAPVFQSIAVSPNVLSPPNHALIAVAVSASVTDNCDAAPATKIVSITCNDTASPGEIQITGAMSATLAASKSNSGNTRIYTITVQATDATGNSSTAQVTVSVPKSGGTTTGGGNPKH
jgi:probable HAF family extracellular repeat protein